MKPSKASRSIKKSPKPTYDDSDDEEAYEEASRLRMNHSTIKRIAPRRNPYAIRAIDYDYDDSDLSHPLMTV